jgi:molybdopterin-guanine dinucleotide biosynthesis protein MobB
MTELSRIDDRPEKEPGLADLLPHLDDSLADLILVEGFKSESIPKIEVYRPELQNPLIADTDKNVIAVASNGAVETQLPVLDLNNPAGIAEFILQWLKTQQAGVKLVSSL